ncbi:MAG: alcohol dehydrogenase catalytic domain-containing protein [Acetobacteraceae bacterium]|nr:alcohol dehydrogenase catalytic domain-containing protein [Acetobacteraceae bacterium]
MRAMVLEEYGKPLVLKQLDVPKPKAHEVVIRVKACGMCGTDLKIAAGKIPDTRIPVTMGHEPAGEVVDVGSEVTSLKPGDRVFAHFYVTCGRCEFCRTNRESICRNLIGRVGFEVDGGYADYLKLPETSFVKFPDNISYEEAAVLGDAVGTAFHALYNRGRLMPSQTVLVMGVGGVGLHVVQVAKAFNARVIGVGRDPQKLELAKQYGADEVVQYTEPTDDYVRRVKGLLEEGDHGVHIVVETVGTPASMEANLKLLRPGGRMVIVGYLPGTTFRVDPLWQLLEEVEILGSRACTKTELQAVVKLVARGLVRPVITQRFELPEVNRAFEELRQNKILGRAVVVP